MVVKHMNDDGNFDAEMSNAGPKLVVVDFFATWCGPCQRIAPVFDDLSNRYPEVIFLKVDVDKCQMTAANNDVRAMPTFGFFLNRVKMEVMTGADPQQLEAKVKEWVEKTSSSAPSAVPGQLDLSGMIMKNGMECLNEDDYHNLRDCITMSSYLESDCDEQLIMNIPFNQNVKIHSIKIKGPAENGPKTVKVFINCPMTLDFDKAEATDAVQQLDLTAKEVEAGEVINLRYVKFQNVQNMQIFVKDNLGGTDKTRIDQLRLYGSPLIQTNMGDFKRVAGKKGEAHA